MAFGIGDFASQVMHTGQEGVDQAEQAGATQMGQMKASSQLQTKMQMEMSQIQLITKMNEALAKMIKAIGDAIKGLAG